MRPPPPGREMALQDVLALLDLTVRPGGLGWLGAWAVDAHLGEQTRPHADLDIVIERRDTPTLVSALRQRSFGDVPRDDTRPENFVFGDGAGREIDFNVVVLDDEGNGVYGPPENGLMFPATALSGTGVLGGRTVSCTIPSWLVPSHTGYQWTKATGPTYQLSGSSNGA